MSQSSQTLTSFSGADLVVTFGTKVIGELQSINWAVQRDKTPVYTLGNPDPRSFSRGKRGITGSLVFAVFNRDTLVEELRKQYVDKGTFPVMFTAAGNAAAGARSTFDEALTMAQWNDKANLAGGDLATKAALTDRAKAINGGTLGQGNYGAIDFGKDAKGNPIKSVQVPQGFDLITPDTLTYADTLPPFDVTCTFANEYGQTAFMRILDVDIINDGSGVSVDTIVMERAMNYIARKISPITSGVYVAGK